MNNSFARKVGPSLHKALVTCVTLATLALGLAATATPNLQPTAANQGATNKGAAAGQGYVTNKDEADFSIVGGHPTDLNAHPSMVQLFESNETFQDNSGFCGGTVIGRRHILTAAHCFGDHPETTAIPLAFEGSYVETPKAFLITAGPARVDKAPHYYAEKVFLHPGYVMPALPNGQPLGPPDANHDGSPFDVAIIQTTRDITQPIQRLALRTDPIPREGLGIVTGFGGQIWNPDGEYYESDPAGRMFEAGVTINKPDICGYPGYNMICAEMPSPASAPESPASCYGDSGGPLTVPFGSQRVQIGIVSYSADLEGYPTSQECGHTPTWYTSTSYVGDWINSVLQEPVSRSVEDVFPNPTEANVPLLSKNALWYNPGVQMEDGSDVSVAMSQIRTNLPSWQAGKAATSGIAFLASEQNFADAMASSSLQSHGPLFLTDPNDLEPEVLAELQRLNIRTVYLLGGKKALSEAITTQLLANRIAVTRISGSNREETARQIYYALYDPPYSPPFDPDNEDADYPVFENFFLTRAYGEGSRAFADVLGIGPMSAHGNRPVILTPTERLTAEAEYFLDDEPVVSIVGGVGAVDFPVEQQVVAYNSNGRVRRIAGSNRFQTAVKLAESYPASHIIILDGNRENAWQAGFTAAGLGAEAQANVLLVAGDSVPPSTAQQLQTMRTRNGSAPDLYCFANLRVCNAIQAYLAQ